MSGRRESWHKIMFISGCVNVEARLFDRDAAQILIDVLRHYATLLAQGIVTREGEDALAASGAAEPRVEPDPEGDAP